MRLVELASDPARVSFSPAAGREIRPRVFLRGGDLDAWSPLENLERPATESDREAFERGARAERGVLELDGVSGAWGTLVEDVEPGTLVRFSALADLEGVLPGHGRKQARLRLLELRRRPARFAYADLVDALILETSGPALYGDGQPRESALFVRIGPDTRALALILELDLRPVQQGVRAVWTDVLLAEAAPVDLLRASCRDPNEEQGVLQGPLTIGEVMRPGFALLPDEEVRIRTRVPEGESRFEVWLGLIPQDFAPEGSTALLSVTVAAPDRTLLLVEEELESRSATEGRWMRAVADVPAGFRGREVELRLRANTWPARPLIAAFGDPRIVPAKRERPGPNVVLISIDTLRADRIGTYGGNPSVTPRLDALAETALVFDRAWSTAPYTLPSHVSLLTGQLPGVHGVQRPGHRIDTVRSHLLSELLHERGWRTGAFTGGGFVDPVFGFARGFERYGTVDPLLDLESPGVETAFVNRPHRDLALLRDNAMHSVVEWIERNADASFLLFFHTFQVHQFHPPAEHMLELGFEPESAADAALHRLRNTRATPSDEERRRLFELYDGTLRCADEAIGLLLDTLERLGLERDTIVVVTADHGEEIGEHGTIGHGRSLYEELLRVPLIVRIPGRTALRSSDLVSIADVAPTILDALDIPVPAGVQGRSLLGELEPRPLFAQVDNLISGLALRDGDTKTIVGLRRPDPDDWAEDAVELSFDLDADPRELAPMPVGEERTERVLEFGRALLGLRDSLGGDSGAVLPLDDATRGHLEDLGYVIDE